MTFTYIRPLGEGRFGRVFLEKDEALDRLCAKKELLLSPGENAGPRIDEAALMQATRHRHVVEVYQAGYSDDLPFIRMEYLPGGNVLDLYSGNPIPIGRSLDLLIEACRGLHHLHTNGVFHRDIKPENMLLTEDGHLKISDFGLASGSEITSSHNYIYEPHTAPEQFSNSTQPATRLGDIYALGVTAYRMVNGEAPFWRSIQNLPSIENGIRAGQIPNRGLWLPHVHTALRRTVSRAMDKEPSRRFPTVLDFRHALERAIPVVSWESRIEPGRMTWIGSQRGSEKWAADLSIASKLAKFETRKLGSAGTYRRVSQYCETGTTVEVLRAAKIALDLIAVQGK